MKEKTQEITEINEEMSSLKRSEKNKKKEKSFLVEVIEIIVIAAVLAFALRTFVIESFSGALRLDVADDTIKRPRLGY